MVLPDNLTQETLSSPPSALIEISRIGGDVLISKLDPGIRSIFMCMV